MKVLFIGNSLTSANNLPKMIEKIAESRGGKLIHESITPGGTRLSQHVSNPSVARKLKTGTWDFVVIQEQSQYPGFSEKQLAKDVYPYAKKLVSMARKNNPKVGVVFYMAMAHRNGDPANKKVSSELLTYEGAQKRVNRCYLKMAKDNEAVIAPVGEVWKVVRKKKPEMSLYSDDTHPNAKGTYLAACVFYATFFKRSSSGATNLGTIERKTAAYLQKIADLVTLKSAKAWDFRDLKRAKKR